MSTKRTGPDGPRRQTGSRPRGPLGERLLTARLARGLTLQHVAQLSGVTASTLGNLERGDVRKPTFSTLTAVAQALDVAPDWLISSDPGAPGVPRAVMRSRRPSAKPTTPLGQRLRAAREARGLSQVQLAAHIGMAATTVAKIETGHSRAPAFTTIAALAQALNLTPSWLMWGDEGEPGAP